MNEKRQIDFRNVTLEELQGLKGTTSGPVYTGLVKSCLKGREMELLRNRFLMAKIPEHDRELKRQEELIGYINSDLQATVEDIELEQKFIEKLEEERAEVYERYLKISQELEKIDKKLANAASVIAKFNSSKQSYEDSISVAEQRKRDISRTALVHKSASIGQLMQHSFAKIVVTEADADCLEGLLVPDVIFDSSLAEDLVDELPFNFRVLSEQEIYSIKQFAGMAMYYYAVEEEMPVMLYANTDIAAVLKKEGL